jgi:hypothetical protein
MGHRGEDQPGGIRGENAGRNVSKRADAQVGDDLLHDGVIAVLPFGQFERESVKTDPASPARPARAISGASPAWASRFGSSNTARVLSRL